MLAWLAAEFQCEGRKLRVKNNVITRERVMTDIRFPFLRILFVGRLRTPGRQIRVLMIIWMSTFAQHWLIELGRGKGYRAGQTKNYVTSLIRPAINWSQSTIGVLVSTASSNTRSNPPRK